MSVTDPAPDVQPDEGQGDGGTEAAAPYADYLDRIPEDVRGDVEPVFRDWDANVTRRFQEASEYRKQWEPFEQAGIQQYQPDQLTWALQVARAAQSDPQALRTWLDQQHGPTTPQQAEPQQPQADEFGYLDPQITQLLEQQVGPLRQQLEQFSEWRTQQEQQAAQAEGARIVESQIEELKAKHGDFNREIVEHLALKYVDQDPHGAISRAFTEYQAFVNQVEKTALQAKVDAPGPAETGGLPDVSPEKFTRIDAPGVKDAALEFLRNNRQ